MGAIKPLLHSWWQVGIFLIKWKKSIREKTSWTWKPHLKQRLTGPDRGTLDENQHIATIVINLKFLKRLWQFLTYLKLIVPNVPNTHPRASGRGPPAWRWLSFMSFSFLFILLDPHWPSLSSSNTLSLFLPQYWSICWSPVQKCHSLESLDALQVSD